MTSREQRCHRGATYLTGRAEEGRSPTDLMLKDVPFLANLLAWGITVIVLVYQA